MIQTTPGNLNVPFAAGTTTYSATTANPNITVNAKLAGSWPDFNILGTVDGNPFALDTPVPLTSAVSINLFPAAIFQLYCMPLTSYTILVQQGA